MNGYLKVSLWLLAATLGPSAMPANEVKGTIATNTTWFATNSPYVLTGGVTVGKGATLRIEPGTSLHIKSGVDLVVTNGGRLLAEGTAAAPIRFTRVPGTTSRWGGIVVAGSVGSPETRISYAQIDGNDYTAIYGAGGTLLLDHLTFGSADRQYLSLDRSSFVVSHCYFPTGTTQFEPMHGDGGIRADGRAIVRDCYFGGTLGYSDTIDFTGGNRDKNQPILQFYNNVFNGTSDDILDLDGTDAWVEGNIFLHAHRNGAPDTAAAISGGERNRDSSEVTIIGNLFFDCDQAATAKEGNFFTMINNTIVRTTKTGGRDSASAVLCVRDLEPRPTGFGVGFYMEGNIIVDAEQLVRNYVAESTTVTFNHNILPSAWEGPGSGNTIVDPKLKHIPQVSETYFTNWLDAQILREWFSLLPGSPALGTGPNGLDKGGVIRLGASISGEPSAKTSETTAKLTVGVNRSGNGIPPRGFPSGSGYTHYKWRLDSGAWSAEMPIATPISVTALAAGPHYVEVIGKRDSGLYQDDPALGADAVVTRSRTWTVQNKQ